MCEEIQFFLKKYRTFFVDDATKKRASLRINIVYYEKEREMKGERGESKNKISDGKVVWCFLCAFTKYIAFAENKVWLGRVKKSVTRTQREKHPTSQIFNTCKCQGGNNCPQNVRFESQC